MSPQEHADYEARQMAHEAILATANLRDLFEEKNNNLKDYISLQMKELIRRIGVIEQQTSQDQKEVSGWKEKGYIAFGGTFFGATVFLFARVMGWT